MGRSILNKRLKEYLKENKIMNFEYEGDKKWSITHDNKRLISMWSQIVTTFPKLKLKELNEYSTFKEFSDLLCDLTESWYGFGSFQHYYLNNSKETLKQYFLEKWIKEIEPSNNYFWEINERNYWEKETWKTYVPDTKENREVVLFLMKRFMEIELPEPKNAINFFGMRQSIPIAVSIFTISPSPLTEEEVNQIVSNCRTSYSSHKKIDKFNFNITNIKNIPIKKLCNNVFYKNGIRGEIKNK
jgi:hypothetical protein